LDATSPPTPHAPAAPSPPSVLGLEDDEVGSRVVHEELRLLSTVLRALDDAREAAVAASRSESEDDKRLLELRDDVAVAKPEDLPALFEQMHTLGALRTQRGKGAVGSLDRASPYFGHLRLEEGGRRRDVLIGGRSYVDSAAGIRVVDWRNAPVSRIYYRYAQGDEYEESLGGRSVEGVVVARRSVAVAAGELVRVASPEGTFVRTGERWRRVAESSARLWTERKEAPRLGVGSDGPSRDASGLGRGAADKHLPAISSLLDKAQFDLVAGPSQGLLAIQGSAGSGKTTVGLHRIAYLAHADPQRFRPDKMLVVVPNEALRHYVGRVLPSLDVEGVPVVTFAQYGPKILAALFPKLPTDFTEETPPVVVRAKSHAALLRAIDAAAERLTTSLDARVEAAMARWPKGDLVLQAWRATAGQGQGRAAAAPPDQRVSVLAHWLTGKRRLDGVGPAADLPDVTRSAVEALGHDLRSSTRSVLSTFDELFTDRGRLAETFAVEPSLGPGQLDQVHEWCVRRARIRADGGRDGDEPALDTEDVAILLRLYQVIRGPLVTDDGKPIRYAHLFVDEVQDASPIELRVLVDLAGGAERSVTFAGDVAQRMFADPRPAAAPAEAQDGAEFDWARLLGELGIPHTKVEPLKVSYRSTAEITQFARGVLGPLAHEGEPISPRHGPPVELFTFASPGEAVAFLADALRQLAREEPYANVALVARFPPQADVYFEGLIRAEVPGLRRVARQDFTWAAGVDVTDVRQTKGLEFDEVVLLETTASSYPDNTGARHALYVGATRAAHQLWCVASERVSPLVLAARSAVPEATEVADLRTDP
jgi:DNA helicase-2/ATP-dependent DNA helicase PcrA